MAAASQDSVADTFCYNINSNTLSLSIDGFVNGISFQMIIDTGSAMSLMSKKAFDKIGESLTVCSKPLLRLANGSAMIPIGRSTVSISYDNTNTDQEIFIYEYLPFEVLLGLDYCSKTKLNIDFNKIKFTNDKTLEELPFYTHTYESENIKQNKIRISNDVNLKAMTGQTIKVSSDTNLPETFFFTPKVLNNNLILEECLCSNNKGQTVIFITNPNRYNVFLRKDTVLGHWNCCREAVSPGPPTGGGERLSPLIDGLERLSLPIHAADKLSPRIGGLDFNISESLSDEQAEELKSVLKRYRKLFACNTKELTITNITTHKIDLIENKPVQSPNSSCSKRKNGYGDTSKRNARGRTDKRIQ